MSRLTKQKNPVVRFECIPLPEGSVIPEGFVVPGAVDVEGKAPAEAVWEDWKGYQMDKMTVGDVLDDWDEGVKVKGVGPDRLASQHGSGARIAPLSFLELGVGQKLQGWRGPNARKMVFNLKRIIYAVHALRTGTSWSQQEGEAAPATATLDDAIKKLQDMGSVSKLANTVLKSKQQCTPTQYEAMLQRSNRLGELSMRSSEWSPSAP